MKEIKKENKLYLSDYDINVSPYLTYSEIQTIANKVKSLDSWAEREETIDMYVLYFATDIGKANIDNYNHDAWLESGIIGAVKSYIKNLEQITEAIKYEESPMRILMQISKEMPEFSKKLDEVLKDATSKK